MSNHEQQTRRQFLRKTAAGAAALGLTACTNATGRGKPMARPNIILLVTDDQRWDALGCAGNPIIQTPNIDRIAAGGTLFNNNFCTTSICCTSRASIVTGMYGRRHGIHAFNQPLSPQQMAAGYPAVLRRAGYRTGFVGKWGVGGKLPADQFDYWGGFGGQGKYFNEVGGKTVHITDILAGRSVEFLNGCTAGQPFCLSVSFKASHCQDGDPKQFLYAPRYEKLYADKTMPVPRTATEAEFRKQPEFIQTSEGRVRWKLRFSNPQQHQTSVRGYYRLITGVDDAVGKMMKVLEDRKLLGNTVVIFTSDNGFFLGEHGLAGKWFMHEESIRTPLLIRDPRVQNGLQGQKRGEMALSIDLAPTILDYAGVRIPDVMQGASLRPLVGGARPDWRQDWFYEHLFKHKRIPPLEGVRTNRWKYVRYIDSKPLVEHLYDVQNDPYGERDLAGDPAHAVQLDAFRKRRQELRTALK